MTGQEFIGYLFLEKLFEAVQREGTLRVLRPEGNEILPLKESILTYSPEKQEVVIHHGLKTIQIFPLAGWNSVHAEPANEGETGSEKFFLFRKEAISFEIEVP